MSADPPHELCRCDLRRIEDGIGFTRRGRGEVPLLPVQHLEVSLGRIVGAAAALVDTRLEHTARGMTVDDPEIEPELRGECPEACTIGGRCGASARRAHSRDVLCQGRALPLARRPVPLASAVSAMTLARTSARWARNTGVRRQA